MRMRRRRTSPTHSSDSQTLPRGHRQTPHASCCPFIRVHTRASRDNSRTSLFLAYFRSGETAHWESQGCRGCVDWIWVSYASYALIMPVKSLPLLDLAARSTSLPRSAWEWMIDWVRWVGTLADVSQAYMLGHHPRSRDGQSPR